METTAVPAGAPAWHERRTTRLGAVLVLVVGLVLIGVGISAFVSASSTDDDTASVKARTAEVRAETDALQAERDEALDAAERALDEAGELDDASSEVRAAADDLAVIYGEGTDASNAMAACTEHLPDEGAFLDCLSTALGGYAATTVELEAATDTLRQALADLEARLS